MVDGEGNRMLSVRDAPIPAPAADREIAITPAMIKAGVSAFTAYDSRFEGPEEAVIEIYEAMQRAHQSSV